MKYVAWDTRKNEWLIATRGIGFEEAVEAIFDGRTITILRHKNVKRHLNQRLFVINIDDYAYVVPFVEDEEKVFLKTIYPSRKHTKLYIEQGAS